MHTCVLGKGCLMYTWKGDDQQASYRLCNLIPLHPIVCALFILIHIIDCGYSVESFSDAHEQKIVILQLIKRLMLNFLANFRLGEIRRGEDFLSVPSSAFELDRPDKSCAHVFT